MSIPDKGELFKKLENTGVQNVRENLAQGLYAGKSKLALIKEWLEQKEREGSKEEKLDEKSDKKKQFALLFTQS